MLFSSLPDDACDYYRALYAPACEEHADLRDQCEDLWRDFHGHADKNFLTDFPRRFHERWFEMYLTVALKRSGLNVTCIKPGPDILIQDGERRIWIEATCASPGQPGLEDTVPARIISAPDGEIEVFDVPKHEYALRILNALSTKSKKFASYLEAGIVKPNDVTSVAINVSQVQFLWTDLDYHMHRALYGVGDQIIAIDNRTMQVVDKRYQFIRHINKRSTGEPVNTHSFISGNESHISAVIGSRASLGNTPPTLGGDLCVYPNLSSKNTWPSNTLNLGEEWLFSTEKQNGWTGRKANYY